MANVPPGAADRARALFGDFIEGRWEQTRGNSAGTWTRAGSPRGGHTRPAPPGASTTWASRLPARSASTPWWNSR